jgi:hemerythrin superfamily protein
METNILSWLSNLHLRIRSILDEMDVTQDRVPQRRLAQHLAQELHAHSEIEENLLYPFVQTVSSEASQWVHQACLVHRSIDGMLHELLTTDFSAERLHGFRDMVARCLEDEERRIFPSLETLDDVSAGELGRRIDAYERDNLAAGPND